VVSVRDDLRALEGYHSPQVDVDVRLNTNESPYPPPPEFSDAVADAVRSLAWHRYPDRSAGTLRADIATLHGVRAESVFVANGSNEVIQTILLAYGGPGRTVLTFEPSYQMHAQIARVTGADVATWDRADDFSLDPDSARAAMLTHRPSVVFLTSPNNPTGLADDPEVLDALVESGDALIVVDEAYAEFGRWTAIDRVAVGSPIVVLRTFSKTWSMAAARLGYLVAPPEIVRALETAVLPYHLDAVTQLAGEIALRHRDEMGQRVDMIVGQRDVVTAGLRAAGCRVVDSSANFVLFSPPGPDATTVWSGLVERGVLVRDCSGWPRLAGWLRVTIGTEHENQRFLHALREVLHERT
jgi:histidinol-phosphate aminotransferase